jgi:hypothetical protein
VIDQLPLMAATVPYAKAMVRIILGESPPSSPGWANASGAALVDPSKIRTEQRFVSELLHPAQSSGAGTRHVLSGNAVPSEEG